MNLSDDQFNITEEIPPHQKKTTTQAQWSGFHLPKRDGFLPTVTA